MRAHTLRNGGADTIWLASRKRLRRNAWKCSTDFFMSVQDSGGAFGSPVKGPVFFERQELEQILRLYGRKVAAGDWRDYAIDSLSDAVAFNIFRRSGEAPFYRIEKRPALARRQGAFAVFNQAGMVLKRGRELGPVLAVLDRTRFDVV